MPVLDGDGLAVTTSPPARVCLAASPEARPSELVVGASRASCGWSAELGLRFACRHGRTVIVDKAHRGPLLIQKPLYPEPDGGCHVMVIHPPGGIVGGDRLTLRVSLDARARVLLTTPGAGRWYRMSETDARQELRFRVGADAVLEWLPQETILFDGSRSRMNTVVDLDDDARFIGWEILCFGRRASGERFSRGSIRSSTSVSRRGRLLWFERGEIEGSGARLRSPAVLPGASVSGTMLATVAGGDPDVLPDCRRVDPEEGAAGVTMLPGLLVARYIGNEAEVARAYFCALWKILRPALQGTAAAMPRIWRT